MFFLKFLDFKGTIPVHIYLLVGRATGEKVKVDSSTMERITGIEIVYIEWAIEQDGRFENGGWLVFQFTN
jgi:hypothetical protein